MNCEFHSESSDVKMNDCVCVREDGTIVRQTRRKVRRPVMQHYMAYHYPASCVFFDLPRQARSKKSVLGE